MHEERTRQGDGHAREPRRASTDDGRGGEALGDVARDVMDQLSMMARDEARLARLSARRYVERLRGDVAPRAAWTAVAAVALMLAGIFALIALFWGLATLIGSAAWTFVIFAALFLLAGVVAIVAARTPRAETAADIEKRFPAVRAHERAPEHALARQETEEAHRRVLEEARREGAREALTARNESAPRPEARPPDRR